MNTDQNQSEAIPLEVVSQNALESMERASIDVQISTAKKFPRSLGVVKQKMLSFATLDVETASGCFFTLPGRKGGDGKPIQGPSIRMAEIAIASYQNIRAGSRVIADDGKIITAQGVCHDLENNTFISVEVKRRVTNRDGQRYSDDMVVMTGNAACSIALRNATFKVVPLALVKPVCEAAKRVAIGDAKTLATRRADALAAFTKMGVEKERVLNSIGVKTLEDIGLEHLETLIGFYNAIKDGDTSIDEAFPAVVKETVAAPIFKAPAPAEDEIPGAEVQRPAEAPKAKRAYTKRAQWPGEGAAPAPAAPVAAPVAQPAPVAPPAESSFNLAKALRGMCGTSGITEAALLDWMAKDERCSPGCPSLDEAYLEQPEQLKAVYDAWSDVVDIVKGGGK